MHEKHKVQEHLCRGKQRQILQGECFVTLALWICVCPDRTCRLGQFRVFLPHVRPYHCSQPRCSVVKVKLRIDLRRARYLNRG